MLKKKYRGNIIDVSPVEYISLTINGGYRGMDERKKYYALAQQVLVDQRTQTQGRSSCTSRSSTIPRQVGSH